MTLHEETALIKQQALLNGTFMKSPSGKPTKLTENQWLYVRTKSFIEWFGDWENNPDEASKIIDEDTGEPMIVYHGTLNKFSVFDFKKSGKVTGLGSYTDHITGGKIPIDSTVTFFFTNNKAAANSYKNLGIYRRNMFRKKIYKNLWSTFSGYSTDKLDRNQEHFINSILSPILKFDILKKIKNIDKVSNVDKQKYAKKFKSMLEKIDKIRDPYEISDLYNKHLNNTENLNLLKELKNEESKNYYNQGYIMEVFLNIRNPLIYDYENSAFVGMYKKTNHKTSYIAARQVKEARQNNNDGVIYKNVIDPYKMNSYGIFNINQVMVSVH